MFPVEQLAEFRYAAWLAWLMQWDPLEDGILSS